MITNEKIIWSFDIHLYEMNGDQSSGRSRPSDEGVGGGGVRSSRPWDWVREGTGLKKIFLASIWSKIKGGGGAGSLGPSPGSATAISLEILYVDLPGA